MRFSWYRLRRLLRKAVSLVWESSSTKSCTPTLSRAIRVPSMFASVLSSTSSFYNAEVVRYGIRREQGGTLRVSQVLPHTPGPKRRCTGNAKRLFPKLLLPPCPETAISYRACTPAASQARGLRPAAMLREDGHGLQAALANVIAARDKLSSEDAAVTLHITQSRQSSCKHKAGR